MTAKQAVYLAINSGKPIDWKSLKAEHRSIQTRKAGRENIQVRFSDSESWLSLDEFASQYVNKTLKDLFVRLSAASKVLPPEQLLDVADKELKLFLLNQALRLALQQGICVSTETYNNVLNAKVKAEQALAEAQQRVANLENQNFQNVQAFRREEREVNNLRVQLDAMQTKQRMLESDKFNLIQAISELKGTAGLVSITKLKEILEQYS